MRRWLGAPATSASSSLLPLQLSSTSKYGGAYLPFLSVSLSTVQLRSQWSGLRMLWIRYISISMSEVYWHSLSLQVRLFVTQSHYADRLAEAVSNVNCLSFLSIPSSPMHFHWKLPISLWTHCRTRIEGILWLKVVYTCNLHHTGKIWKSMHQSTKVLDRSSQHAAGEDCSIGRYKHL
jgi:hypothetical protein